MKLVTIVGSGKVMKDFHSIVFSLICEEAMEIPTSHQKIAESAFVKFPLVSYTLLHRFLNMMQTFVIYFDRYCIHYVFI